MGSKVLWALIVGFLLGVFARSAWPIGLSFAYFSFVIATALCALYVIRRAPRTALALAVGVLAFGLGIVRMHTALVSGDALITARAGQMVTILGTVYEAPDVRDAQTRLYVHVDTLISKYTKEKVDAGMLVVAPAHTGVSYGDSILAYGTLALPQAFATGAGRQFEYPEYLAVRGIQYELMRAQAEVHGANTGNSVKAFAIGARQWFTAGLTRALPEPEAGFASGITVGDKRAIGPALTNAFRTASLIHIVVFSGYHVGVVGNAARALLQWLPRVPRFGILALLIAFFVLMSGAAASAVRAGAMALIAMYARASGRTFAAERALGVVALGMLAWNPLMLLYDPSFQLSTLATLGLIVCTPVLYRLFSRVPQAWGVREILASTTGAQLAVMPLLLYQSGSLSLVSLPANLLALVPVPLAMLLSFIAGVFGALFGAYAIPLALPAYVVLAYIIAVAQFFASLPFAAVSFPAFSAWWLAPTYLLLFGAFALADKKAPPPEGAVQLPKKA